MIWIVWIHDDYMPHGFFTSEFLAKDFIEYYVNKYPGTSKDDFVIEPTRLNKEYTT